MEMNAELFQPNGDVENDFGRIMLAVYAVIRPILNLTGVNPNQCYPSLYTHYYKNVIDTVQKATYDVPEA